VYTAGYENEYNNGNNGNHDRYINGYRHGHKDGHEAGVENGSRVTRLAGMGHKVGLHIDSLSLIRSCLHI
jgi:flagellar biosynthesis/type III secretory pathway protein FliH